MSAETVEITQEEYGSLVRDSIELQCLHAAGVDNWEGYDEAMAMFAEEMEDM